MDLQTLAMEWTETNQHWLIEVPIRIGAYLLAILIARFILHRMIDRATGRSGKAKKVSGDENAPAKPALLRGLRDRVPSGATGQQANERRQQRAQTIGSVLKSLRETKPLALQLSEAEKWLGRKSSFHLGMAELLTK